MMKNRRFWIGLLLAIPGVLSALEIALTSPGDGATVPLLNDAQKAFLAMPRAERVAFFTDAAKRKQLRSEAGWLPRPVDFAWTSDASGETKFRVLVSESPDMSGAIAVPGVNGKAKIDNLKINWKYYWQVEAATADGRTVKSAVRSFTTESLAPRLLRFPNVPNVRDLGGRRARNGMYVKQGLVFRTAGMNNNASRGQAKDDKALFRAFPEYRAVLPLYLDLQKRLKADPRSVRVVPYSLKNKWIVFKSEKTELSAAETDDLKTLASVPKTLCGVAPETVTANYRGRVVLPVVDKTPRTAVLMQEFHAPADGIMQIATGGNWYWNVRVNGRLVYSRMQGNGRPATTSNYHYFVPVRRGKNLMVVVLRSGPEGWMWCCGKRKKQNPARNIDATIKALRSSGGGRKKGASRVTPEGRAIFLGQFGVKSDIDLRTNGECWGMKGSPLGPEVKWFHYSSAAYAGMQGKRGKEQFAKVFRVFLDEKNYPIVFHCIAGQDRTGAVAFILNGLLGVPEEELYLDWEATAFWNPAVKFNHRDRFDKLIAGFRKLPGKDLYEQIENYVLSCGFTRGDIEKFRAIMLEKR